MADVSGDINDFYHMTMAAFEQNVDENFGAMTEDVYGAADDAAKDLKRSLGRYSQMEDLPEREAEHYEKGWKAYKHKPVEGHVEAVVANAHAPQLTHLVEKGHELFIFGKDTGKRTKARPHIRDAYERATARHFSGGEFR